MGNRSRDISKDIIITRGKRIEFSVKKKDGRFDKLEFDLWIYNHKFNNERFDK